MFYYLYEKVRNIAPQRGSSQVEMENEIYSALMNDQQLLLKLFAIIFSNEALPKAISNISFSAFFHKTFVVCQSLRYISSTLFNILFKLVVSRDVSFRYHFIIWEN